MQLTMTDIQEFDLTVDTPLDDKERPAEVDGPLTIVSSAASRLEVTQTGPVTAHVRALLPGTADVLVSADARLGPGENIITVPVVTAEITAAEATHFAVTLSPLTEQP